MRLLNDTTMLFTLIIIYIASVKSNELETSTISSTEFESGLVKAEKNDTCTTCIKINTTCYNVSYLFEIDAPFRSTIIISKLSVMRSTNTLYYSFEPKIEDDEYYKIGFTNLDDPVNSSVISGGKQIMNFGTFDIDQDNGLVYLGGSDGVYVFDTKMNRVAPYSSRGDTVMNVFFKGNIYFVRYGEFKIVKKKGDTFDILIDFMPVKMFVINKYNVIVFLSFYGLFVKRGDETMWLSKNAFFRGLVIDNHDVIYAWWIDGIYQVVIEPKLGDSRIVKVANIPSIGAVTFDKENNFLFTAGKSLYRLIETALKVC
ncbi:ommochrome-binding protein-like [Pararge aegeria]|uniref:Jg2319 protein n=1 Tax=Pararge aegeria aegeria TaxID=348720 RepID=A0A8S4S498_9NEOP|nr:ommochrome-binding protein-like [Pararge aegeria]CAH2251677.1 jg2319 [Pararge aegeria aegeria]